jgi:hypothetical protein
MSIRALGVHHVRDGLAYRWVAPHLYSIYGQVAEAGIHPDLVAPNPGPTEPSAQELEPLLVHYPGADALEAPNEYDQAKNPNWAGDLRIYLSTLLHVARGAGIPLIGPSLTQPASYGLLGDVSRLEDFSNLHAYWGGRNPETGGWGGPDAQGHAYGSFAWDFDKLNMTGRGKPIMMTETGYVAGDVAKRNLIPESVEAIYEPRLLLHAWRLGVQRTYIYELMDDPSSTHGLGLMRSDLTPRPAYRAVATLMRLLADPPTTRSPGTLTWSLKSGSTRLESVLLQKEDGSFWLAIWNPACIYDVNEMHSIPVLPEPVTITVEHGMRIRNAWSFNDQGDASRQAFHGPEVTLPIGSAVVMLEIRSIADREP